MKKTYQYPKTVHTWCYISVGLVVLSLVLSMTAIVIEVRVLGIISTGFFALATLAIVKWLNGAESELKSSRQGYN